MQQERAVITTGKLVETATRLFQTNGYSATSVDDICRESGVKKGAFFHHFASKQTLAVKCLEEWRIGTREVLLAEVAKFSDPTDRLRSAMDFFLTHMTSPEIIKSCLAGTTLQEVSETNEPLREAANSCLVNGVQGMVGLIEQAAASTGAKVDARAMGNLWIATLQGALILYKGSRDPNVIKSSLEMVKKLILNQVASC